ncbi:cytochrome P450 [Radiomyces spectabilis]|uniref:cytochrome P450 n=1 Tax=Radiomyces spectabilis TaxID=64574 RepID=UPI00221E420C|nr:cytochrome P450 [Radiomyces spectabilis]KAI8372833.1 cytochrome P450 [Radiomyces spectabilis]
MATAWLVSLTEEFQKLQQHHPRVTTGVLGAVVGTVILGSLLRRRHHASTSEPQGRKLPSPRGWLPIVGHVWKLSESPHLQMVEWAKELGPIYEISMGGRPFLVLNDAEVVRDLLEINGQKNSNRLTNTVVKLMGHDGLIFAWGPDNAFLKTSRRLMLGSVSKNNLERKYPLLYNTETKYMLEKLHKEGVAPEGTKLANHCYLYTINVAMHLLFGVRFSSPTDPKFEELHKLAVEFAELGLAMLIDCPKPLEFLIRWYKERAIDCQNRFQSIFKRYIQELRDKRAQQKPEDWYPCLMGDILDVEEKENLSAIELENIAATVMLAATDTTAATIQNTLNILVNHPEVQAKAQQELDQVVGSDQLPREKDLDQLPYIQSIVTEVLRYRPPLWLNLPHMTGERQIYKGYEIPAGLGIMHNIYATNFDPSVHANPEVFNPDRFYQDERPLTGGHQRDHWSFGAGRRLCPGSIFAEKSIQLLTARVLWSYTVACPTDKHGQLVPVPITDIKLPLAFPEDCNVRFIPRRQNIQELFANE